MNVNIRKRSGNLEPLDITKIRKMTTEAIENLSGVSLSELELEAQLKFIDGMLSSDIQDALIKTAVEKIDIDVPNWTFVAARLFLYDLYHKVGRVIQGEKGKKYCHLRTYFNHAISINRITPTFVYIKPEKDSNNIIELFDLDELDSYIKPERDLQFNYMGIKAAYDKYLIKDQQGRPVELPQQMFMAIAMFLAHEEETKEQRTNRAKEFYDVISTFEVMLATPTLSGARKNRNQLASCYIGSVDDNIEGIFDAYKEMGLLSKHGGGIGWDWNDIRAIGGDIDGNKAAAGGPIPFLKINNDIAIAVDQLGVRKGSIAVYVEPWHMNINEFIDLKKNSGEERLRAHDLFPALWIPDLFMERVVEDGIWTLFDPVDVKDLHTLIEEEFDKAYIAYEHNPNIRKETIKAKDLWKKILTSYFESGSPFLCWKDTANRANPNPHVGRIRSSNLCTEIFQNTSPDTYRLKLYNQFEDPEGTITSSDESYLLITEETIALLSNGFTKQGKYLNSLDTIIAFKNPDDEDHMYEYLDEPFKIYNIEKERIPGKTAVCNLASINLSKVNNKEDLERVIPIAVRMLDKVIDLNFYPLKKVKDTNIASRAIGLGAMGEAQYLAENQIMFGSQEHFDKINYIYECISYNTIKASSALGREKGNYPDFDGSNWSKGIMPHDHANHNVYELTNGGITNAYSKNEWDVLREVASKNMRNGYLMAIAPTSSISILVGTSQAIEAIYKKKWFEEGLSGLIPCTAPNLNPDTWNYYPSAFEVNQLQLIKAAAIRQKWIDQGQSTNIFISLDKASGKYLNDIYMLAWRLGCKSTYYLRSQSPEAKKAEMVDIVDRTIECSGCQ